MQPPRHKKLLSLKDRGHIHLILPLLAVILVGFIGSYVYMHLSSADSLTNADYLESGISGKCLDDWHNGSAGGTVIDSYVCNKTAAQQWNLTSEVNNTVIVQNANGSCLDNWQARKTSGNPVKLYKCNAKDGAQLWTTAGNILKNPMTGMCIEDPNGSTTNGTALRLYACNGGSDQKWTPMSASTTTTPSPTSSAAPTITGIGYTATTTSATITWTTSGQTTTGWVEVNYATPASAKTVNSGAGTTHSVTVTGLTAKTTYAYEISAASTTGKTTLSAGHSLTTAATATVGTGGGSTGSTDGCTINGAIAPCMNGSASGTGASGYGTLALDDEFNGTSLNTSNWIPGRRNGSGGTCTTACGGYNPSAEAELFNSSEVSESGGSLVLTAINKSLNGGANPWTTGDVEMQNGKNFVHGFFEARIKVPDPTTAWTGFWLSSANTWPPELDIFEFSQCGNQPTFNNHGNTPNSNVNAAGWPCGQAYGTSSTDFTQWHTYGLLWTANTLQVYFDGVLQHLTTYSSSDAIPTTPMYPILSYTIHKGTNVPNNSQMDVDYMRVWCPGGGTNCMTSQ